MTGNLIALFYTAILHANPTDELEERLLQMNLPDPYLPSENPMYSDDILYYYPALIEYLKGSVCSFQFESYPLFWLTLHKSRHSKPETRSIFDIFGSMSNMSQHFYNSTRSTAQVIVLFSLLSPWNGIFIAFLTGP